jgi:hypothetical protein
MPPSDDDNALSGDEDEEESLAFSISSANHPEFISHASRIPQLRD